MRVAFLSSGSPETRAAWSGTPYYCLRALREHFDAVEPIGSPPMRALLAGLRRVAGPARIDPLREPALARLYGLALRRRLDRFRPDAVFGLASTTQLYGLVADYPVIHCSDATFRGMRDYYPDWFSGLAPRTLRNGERLEGTVIRGAALSLYASDWAADSARQHYGAAHAHAVPFGANLDAPPPDADPPRDGVCRLLFVGVDWVRKGGDLAHALLCELQARGVRAELHVVGCPVPDALAGTPGLVAHGFLSKGDPAAATRLRALFGRASFLVVPSRQEAYGLVFCEAGAYGLPSLATATGGIPTIVRPGVNGFLFGLDADAAAYADVLLAQWEDPAVYAQLRESTRARARAALTWESWGAASAALIRAAARRSEAAPVPARAAPTPGLAGGRA